MARGFGLLVRGVGKNSRLCALEAPTNRKLKLEATKLGNPWELQGQVNIQALNP